MYYFYLWLMWAICTGSKDPGMTGVIGLQSTKIRLNI